MGNPGLDYGGVEQELDWLTPATPRNIWTNGIWVPLQEAVEARAIEIRLSTPVTELIVDSDTGEIVGVKSEETAFRAKKAVVLAAGSYSRNPVMLREYLTKAPVVSIGSMTDDGDGLKLGCDAGGKTNYFGCMGAICFADGAFCAPMMEFPVEAPSIAVNTSGKRFTNEQQYYDYLIKELLGQQDGYCWVIASGPLAEESMFFAQGFGIIPTEESIGLVRASSIEDLASEIGLDPATLSATVADWNACVAANADPVFGRTNRLYKIDEGPYLAAKAFFGASGAFGGLAIDTSARVLNALSGTPLPRLYAAGVNCNAMGRVYPTCGTSVTTGLVTGMLAARDALALPSLDA
jgi:succinate dehydrogenase/fumarate reductase flavoprotein subunit